MFVLFFFSVFLFLLPYFCCTNEVSYKKLQRFTSRLRCSSHYVVIKFVASTLSVVDRFWYPGTDFTRGPLDRALSFFKIIFYFYFTFPVIFYLGCAR